MNQENIEPTTYLLRNDEGLDVKFDVVDTFDIKVDLQSCINLDLDIEGATLYWWFEQPAESRLQLTYRPSILSHALTDFTKWLPRPKWGQFSIWSHGANFDGVILRNAYQATGIECPWSYRDEKCYRTVKNMFSNIKYIHGGEEHVGLDDAYAQAKHLIEINSYIKGKQNDR